MKKAFTLAEVLIVLGIVGIVAAITLPTLLTDIKRSILKNRFLRADAVVSQAILATKNELGYEWDGFYLDSDDDIKKLQDQANEIFLKQFKFTTKMNACNFNGAAKGYFLENDGYRKYCWYFSDGNNFILYILPDGTAVSPILLNKRSPFTRGEYFTVAIDTNGPYKGPNAYGYDLFSITSERVVKANIGQALCDPYAKNTGWFAGCYWAAKRNTSALPNTKYWDGLYRSKDYWDKHRESK